MGVPCSSTRLSYRQTSVTLTSCGVAIMLTAYSCPSINSSTRAKHGRWLKQSRVCRTVETAFRTSASLLQTNTKSVPALWGLLTTTGKWWRSMVRGTVSESNTRVYLATRRPASATARFISALSRRARRRRRLLWGRPKHAAIRSAYCTPVSLSAIHATYCRFHASDKLCINSNRSTTLYFATITCQVSVSSLNLIPVRSTRIGRSL
mmetsp:Transcript_16298/g.26908  ORF Transcript_16298/g.26908 Transcript_16298/m.26908 type:complete len:207 (-) Transcript_16298:319-939(-)